MSKRLILALIVGVLGGLFLMISLPNQKEYWQSPFAPESSYEYPSFSTMDSQGNVYTIDRSLSRIRKISPAGEILYQINGGSRSDKSFFYASEIAVDKNGFLYVLNQVMMEKGFYIEREEILRYNPEGNFDRLVNSRQYKPQEITNNNATRGRQLGLALKGEVLYWYELQSSGVVQYRIHSENWHLEQKLILAQADAPVYISSVTRIDDTKAAFINKKGEVFELTEEGDLTLVYSGDQSAVTGLSVPWWIQSDSQKRLYFSDLTRSEIRRIDPDGSVKTILSNSQVLAKTQDPFPYIYYVFSLLSDGRVVTVNDVGVLSVSPTGELDLIQKGGRATVTALILRALFWAGLVLLGVALIFFLSFIYSVLLKKRTTIILKQLFLLLPAVGLILAVVTSTMLGSFSARYEELAFNQMSQGVQVIGQKIDTVKLALIKNQRDFMNADYRDIRTSLHKSLNFNKDPWNNRFYFALHRILDGKIFTFMYLNDGASTLHPFSYLNDPNNSYWKAAQGEIATLKVSDAWGAWVLGVGPVVDESGKVVAILELGRDMYGFQRETNQVLTDLLPFILLAFGLLVVLFFAFTYFFLEPLRTLRKGVGEISSGKWDITLPIRGRDEVADLTMVFNRMTVYIRNYIEEIVALSQGYARFVPKEFLTHLNRESVKEIQLGDQIQREMTVLFTDIRSFTTISESMTPKENFDFLNSYLGLVGPQVRRNQGFIDKYIGDAIMALFPRTAEDAIQTAVEISNLLYDFNETQKLANKAPIQIGIGIHTGLLMLGILGETERMESTVISDNVNLASRIEGLTKFFDANILISSVSYHQIAQLDRYLCRYLGKVRVKGKKDPVGLYEVLEGSLGERKQQKISSKDSLETAILHYQKFELEKCESLLRKVLEAYPEEKPAKIYLNLCLQAKKLSAKPLDWNGAIVMTDK